MDHHEHVETLIIGGGQAGLATGYCLRKRGRGFLILDSGTRVGDQWRHRWDSLRLFTPARYDSLPGMPFPARGAHLPTKDEVADYLQAYATRFGLPIRTGVRVEQLTRAAGSYVATTSAGTFGADNVVLATGMYRTPKVPDFAGSLDASIRQLHSLDYRNPAQLRAGRPLLEDQRVLDVATVLWCTGFDPDLSYVDPPLSGRHGYPDSERGRIPGRPGLYVMGVAFQTSLSPALLGGVGQDAELIADHITDRMNPPEAKHAAAGPASARPRRQG